MKTKLVSDIIKSHFEGDEAFYKAVFNLITDEEKKGNIGVATEFRNVYINYSNHTVMSSFKQPKEKDTFFGTMSLPIDKESSFELIELLYPNEELNQVVLSKNIRKKLNDIVVERNKLQDMAKRNIIATNRILFCGPPGCGKTLTAKALANELNLPMAYVRLDGLISSLLGETSVNLRKIFEAVKGKEIILFLDEFDAIAKKRDDQQELGELKRVVTTLLQNFDTLSPSVILIAATNHPQLLDPAIWRRFNSIITIDLPDLEQRIELISFYINKYSIKGTLNISLLAKIMEGMNCSQIEEFIVQLGKYQIINEIDTVDMNNAITLLVNILSQYSSDDNYWETIKQINERGVSLRAIAQAIGVPHTTIQYKLGGKKNDRK